MDCKDLRRYKEAYENPNLNKLADWEKGVFEEIGERIRKQSFLTKDDLEKINEWKLKENPLHLSINEKRIAENNDDDVRIVTKAAIKVSNDRLKIDILCALHGVKVPIASTILTFYDPENYAVIDKNVVTVIKEEFEEKINQNSSKGYENYLKIINDLRKKCGMDARDVDKALFAKARGWE